MDEITYPFQNFNSVAVEGWNEWVILSHSCLDLWLFIHAGIKVNWY